jgi:FdhD protein
MLARPTPIVRTIDSVKQPEMDLLAEEAPLEIRIIFGQNDNRKEKSLSVTMRTPGDDISLALGFLFTEGMIDSPSEVLEIRHCEQTPLEARGNVIKVWMNTDWFWPQHSMERNFYTTSSCGVCGKSSIESIHSRCSYSISSLKFDEEILGVLPEKLRLAQIAFKHTGGIHASALFNNLGEIQSVAEDVGRHNALDKIIGKAFINHQLPLSQTILLVSGRLSFELVQKAATAGIPVIAAIGAPSSLAVELAKKMNIKCYGFVKEKRWNNYTPE